MKRRLFTVLAMLVLTVVFAVSVNAATELSTAADIIDLMNTPSKWTGSYVLTNDIDLDDYTGTKAQARIGDNSTPFTGTFDGNGYAIRGVNLVGASNRWGFFGWAAGATIEDLTLFGTISSSKDGVGGFVGLTGNKANTTTTIRNCVNYCSVSSTNSSMGRAAGIVAVHSANKLANVNLVIENCVNYGNISVPKHGAGILGRAEDNSAAASGTVTVKNCANFGTVSSGTHKLDGMGGIVAVMLPFNSVYKIENCYNAGAVTAGYAIGGIVGRLNAYKGAAGTGSLTVTNCVNVADVTALVVENTGTSGSVGGILGENNLAATGANTKVTVQNCFNSGALTNPVVKKTNCGMIFGYNMIGTNFTCTTGNSYAAGTPATTGHNTTGAVAIAAADLGKASAYPATFNTDGTYLYSDEGPFMAAVHNETIVLEGTDCVCALCGKKLLETEQIGGETWIQITSSADLLLLMANSKAGNEDALGYNYILTKDINLAGDERQYPIGQPEASATSPVGAHFEGKFDGDGHTIKGIKLVDAGKNNSWGLFATIGGTNGNTVVIKDLTVEGTFTGYRFMGAVAGLVYGNFEMSGCTTTANTTVTSTGGRTIGGVVGAAIYNVTAYKDGAPYYATIENCTNNATVHHPSTDSRTGGIIGQFNTATTTEAHFVLSGCVNNGKVTGGRDLGGVIGYLEPYLGSALVENCVNNGTVTSTQNRVGGVIGLLYTEKNPVEVDIIGCENHGAVTSNLTTDNSYVAGILGWAVINRGATDLYMADSINTGKIVGKASGGRVAGIFGSIDTKVGLGTTVLVENCLNLGAIEATVKRAAGIGGYVYTDGTDTIPTVVNCVNAGTIKAPEDVGGIIALTNGGKLVGCINNGTVTATGANVGGITGWIAGVSALENNLNMGAVTGGSAVNGIVGFRGTGTFTITENTYMAGTKTDAKATEVAAADAQRRLMDWCMTYGPNADAEEPANSDHYYAESGTECLVCGAEKHELHADSVTPVPEIVVEATCVQPGVQYDVCPECLHRENETVLDIDPDNHELGWDLTGAVAVYGCQREGCGHVVDTSSVTGIYVAENGDDANDGLSASTPLASYAYAFDIAAKLGRDTKLYLKGTVSLPARVYDSEYNTIANTFEESPHDTTVTVTTAPGASKAKLKFATPYYFLYGPTTFENINIQATTPGMGKLVGDSKDSGGIIFAGRGFHLTMGLGVAMPKISKNMTYTKDDSGIDGLNSTTTISDSKVYVWGGFQKNGYYEGVDADAAMSTSTELTILSGTYWTIGGGNRGFGTAERNGMQVKMTIGDPTISTRVQTLYIVPFSSDSGVYTNCTADVHYTGRITVALNYRALFSDGHASSGNVANHFFHKQYSGSKVGDFSVGTRAECAVNLYYATPVEHNEVVNGFRGKTTKFAVSYKQVGEEMSFPEWCVERGGGHDYVDGVCTFCEIKPCSVHSHVQWDVVREATCNVPGLEASRCTVCFEHVEEREIPEDENAHVASWVYGDTSATLVCSICGDTLKTVAYADLAVDGELHVSAAGTADGDGTAAAPIADFELAMTIAAAQTEDVTIYIHDMAIIPDSGSSATVNDFMEPAHTNRITVTSYGEDRATLRFNGDTPNNIALVYNVNGPTTFENLELSAWNATSRMYIAARHNDFVLGEGLTSDYQRGVDQAHAGTDIIVLGGCYGSSFNPAEGCKNLDVNLTVLSGSYGAIIGGAYYCKNCGVDTGDADIHLTLGGDVMVRRQLYTGSYGNSSNYAHSNDIYINIVGDITVASEFGFGPYGVEYTDPEKTQTAPYMAQNVYLKLYDGEIYGGSFYASNDPLHPYAIGAVMGGDASTARIAQKLYVYADGTSRDALAMYDLMLATLRGDERNDGKWVATLWEETYCHANQGDHTPAGDAIDHADATCVAEGYDLYNCSACGADYAEKIAMLDHVYGDAISIDATCIAPAMERETCSECGGAKHTIVGNEFADHTDPEKTGFCQVCNLDLTVNCEHNFGEDVPFASGCGTGTKRTCSECGKVEVEVYGDGHNYGKYVVTVEPTETAAGIKTRTCKGCGKVETALLYATDAVNASAVATDAEGNLADFAVENSKLTKGERAALNALLQQDAYGTEVKISYETDASGVTNITYSIPVPVEYTDYENVRIVVRDDEGKIHFVEFRIEKGYIVFTF